jgi:anti-anti-sigma factor
VSGVVGLVELASVTLSVASPAVEITFAVRPGEMCLVGSVRAEEAARGSLDSLADGVRDPDADRSSAGAWGSRFGWIGTSAAGCLYEAERSPEVSDFSNRPALELRVEPDRGRVVVTASGDVDMATVEQLDATVAALREDGWNEVVLDLAPVGFMDSTGLRWLLRADRDARANDWRLSLVDGSPSVARLLDLTGLRTHFTWARRS